jgi:hypothetical protein
MAGLVRNSATAGALVKAGAFVETGAFGCANAAALNVQATVTMRKFWSLFFMACVVISLPGGAHCCQSACLRELSERRAFSIVR